MNDLVNDTISRQAAIKELSALAIALYGYDSTNVIRSAIYKLQNLSSAQFIQCGSCVWWDDSPSSTSAPLLHKCRRIVGMYTEATGFCCYGRKKDNRGGCDE